MKKYFIAAFALLVSISFTANAQTEATGEESSEESGGYGTKAGDITGSILFGRGNFLSYGSVPSAPGSNYNWPVSGQAPYAGTVGASSTTNIIGGEARYFVTDIIAVTLSGGAILRNTPALQNVQYFYNSGSSVVQGNDPSTSNAGWIPQYGSIVADNTVEANINLGGEYHFPSSRFNRLFPYLGLNLNYYYSRRSVYDPSVYYENNSNGTGGTGVLVYDVGIRSAEINGIGAQAVAGIDVYLVPGVFVGLSTRPITYLYTWNTKSPGPGLETLQGESNTYSFFSQTFLKVGFILGDL